MENSIEEILNQSWSRVPTDLFIRLHWERPLQRKSIRDNREFVKHIFYHIIQVLTEVPIAR